MRSILDGLIDLLAPPRCPACDVVVDPGAADFCDACGPLLDPWPSGDDAAYVYGGPIAQAVLRLKYARRWELCRPLGTRMARASLRFVDRVDAIVPVPLHGRRLRERGFNQAALLAEPVARALAIPLRLTWLERVRDTTPQASLSPAARTLNVRGAFRARRKVSGRVLLIDDVRTTGSTLAECARALIEGGASEVSTLVLARAEG